MNFYLWFQQVRLVNSRYRSFTLTLQSFLGFFSNAFPLFSPSLIQSADCSGVTKSFLLTDDLKPDLEPFSVILYSLYSNLYPHQRFASPFCLLHLTFPQDKFRPLFCQHSAFSSICLVLQWAAHCC